MDFRLSRGMGGYVPKVRLAALIEPMLDSRLAAWASGSFIVFHRFSFSEDFHDFIDSQRFKLIFMDSQEFW